MMFPHKAKPSTHGFKAVVPGPVESATPLSDALGLQIAAGLASAGYGGLDPALLEHLAEQNGFAGEQPAMETRDASIINSLGQVIFTVAKGRDEEEIIESAISKSKGIPSKILIYSREESYNIMGIH